MTYTVSRPARNRSTAGLPGFTVSERPLPNRTAMLTRPVLRTVTVLDRSPQRAGVKESCLDGAVGAIEDLLSRINGGAARFRW
ncbi:hypothetical protein [Asanoa ishikariensis]|uniref:hypothetical protein n=1 Tax=Asanoa ishikariensis TaxID=137265 RepID=UPI00115FD521|nr:hypothetical protein [Asanoa ishikariensis]